MSYTLFPEHRQHRVRSEKLPAAAGGLLRRQLDRENGRVEKNRLYQLTGKPRPAQRGKDFCPIGCIAEARVHTQKNSFFCQ